MRDNFFGDDDPDDNDDEDETFLCANDQMNF